MARIHTKASVWQVHPLNQPAFASLKGISLEIGREASELNDAEAHVAATGLAESPLLLKGAETAGEVSVELLELLLTPLDGGGGEIVFGGEAGEETLRSPQRVARPVVGDESVALMTAGDGISASLKTARPPPRRMGDDVIDGGCEAAAVETHQLCLPRISHLADIGTEKTADCTCGEWLGTMDTNGLDGHSLDFSPAKLRNVGHVTVNPHGRQPPARVNVIRGKFAPAVPPKRRLTQPLPRDMMSSNVALVRRERSPSMNDLGLDLTSLTRRGRKPDGQTATVVRPATEGDIALLAEPAPDNAPLKRLSERHHSLARALARGIPPGEAAVMFGYDPSRVSILQGSPAFAELLAFYRGSMDAQFADFAEQMGGLASDAVGILRDRLEADPDAATLGQLLEIAKFGADRTGFGPQAKTEVTVRTELGSRLMAARSRLEAPRQALLSGVEDAEVLGATATDRETVNKEGPAL